MGGAPCGKRSVRVRRRRAGLRGGGGGGKKASDVEADGTAEGKERRGHGKEESKIDVKYVGIKAY